MARAPSVIAPLCDTTTRRPRASYEYCTVSDADDGATDVARSRALNAARYSGECGFHEAFVGPPPARLGNTLVNPLVIRASSFSDVRTQQCRRGSPRNGYRAIVALTKSPRK